MKKTITILLLLIYYGSGAQTCVSNTSSLLLKGSNYVSLVTSNALIITDSLTVEAWIKDSIWATTPAQGTIFCKHSWAFTEQGYVLRAGGNGVLSFTIGGDSMGINTSWKELTSPPILTLNKWYHVAGTFDGDSIKLFIDGNQVASKAFHGRIVASTGFPASIGRLSDQTNGPGAGWRYWQGYIDEVRVWKRALSQSEIQSRMNNHLDTAIQNGLAGYWRFNENTGNIVHDYSGNNINGTPNSSLLWRTDVPFSNGPSVPHISYNSAVLTCDSLAFGYQWYYYNNAILVNGNQQTYQATQTGVYLVQVSDVNGCTTLSDPFAVTSVGMSELTTAEIKIDYSVQQSTVLLTTSSIFNISEIVLSDATGRIILTQKCHSKNVNISFNKPQQGAYLLNINSNNGRLVRKLWIGN